MPESFDENARRLRELNAELHRAAREKHGGPRHRAALDAWHHQYDALAFPGGLEKGLARLNTYEIAAVEQWLRFLEADPYFFRSGYTKQKVLRRFKRCSFTPDQERRLASLILHRVDVGGEGIFRGYSRLADCVYSHPFVEALRQKLSSGPDVARRAAEVLHGLRSKGYATEA